MLASNLDTDISRNLAKKTLAEPAKFNQIEVIAARIAQLKAEYDRIDGVSTRLSQVKDQSIGISENIYLEKKMTQIEKDLVILEEALSLCEPSNARELLIVLAVSSYRLDSVKGCDPGDTKNMFERDCDVLERTLDNAIDALEKLAGVTLKELGLETYSGAGRPRTVDELIAAASKAEAQCTT
jgi:hypothetical protein